MRSLLEQAAVPTLERIRRDSLKAPRRVRPLLAYLEAHLFDSDLDGTRLRQACGIRGSGVPAAFRKALSLPPYAYIEDCRMEVACRLLRDSDLKVWEIAHLLGYSAIQVFSRAFGRWSGLRPSVFRRRARKAESDAPQHGGVSDLAETLKEALRGTLPKHEAGELSRRLAELYPESFPFHHDRQAGRPDQRMIRALRSGDSARLPGRRRKEDRPDDDLTLFRSGGERYPPSSPSSP